MKSEAKKRLIMEEAVLDLASLLYHLSNFKSPEQVSALLRWRDALVRK